jgi:hypothetical protein
VNVYPAAVKHRPRRERLEFQSRIFERRRMWEMRAGIEVNEIERS